MPASTRFPHHRPASLLVVLFAAAVLPFSAQAGLFDDEEARKAILDLRTRFEQQERLQQQQAQEIDRRKAEATELNEQLNVLRRATLDLNSQIELLRSELARLRGQDEQASHSSRDVTRDLAEMQRRQKDLLATIAAQDERLRQLEPQKVNLDGREATVDAGEKKSYDDAIAILRKGEFARATEALLGFQKRFPGSAYAGHVQYWLGNAQYGKGDVKDAAVTFRNLVSNEPGHPRAAESLLALANCQIELKDSKSARKTLDELVKTYPQSEAAQAGRERLARLK